MTLPTININDLKKNDRVLLSNGWSATVMDNKRGLIRTMLVEGFAAEAGSVYAFDVVYRLDASGNPAAIVGLTPAQAQKRDRIRATLG